jgi:hypothetical protein
MHTSGVENKIPSDMLSWERNSDTGRVYEIIVEVGIEVGQRGEAPIDDYLNVHRSQSRSRVQKNRV